MLAFARVVQECLYQFDQFGFWDRLPILVCMGYPLNTAILMDRVIDSPSLVGLVESREHSAISIVVLPWGVLAEVMKYPTELPGVKISPAALVV